MSAAQPPLGPVSRIRLSEQGPDFSRLVFGCWRLLDSSVTSTPEATLGLIEAALEVGITTFDHADIYGNYGVEELFGMALKRNPSLKSKIEIVTKTGIKLLSNKRGSHRIKSYDSSLEHITVSVENSLKALGTEHIDLLLVHRPDYLVDPDEIAEAFTRLHTAGKVKHFGVSNHTVSQFELLQSRCPYQLVTNQIEISPFALAPLDNGVLNKCLKARISPMAWSPLGGGKLFDLENPTSRRLNDTCKAILARRPELHERAGVAHVLYAWLLAHPSKPVIVLGTGNEERITASPISEMIGLTREEWYEIWQAATGHEVP